METTPESHNLWRLQTALRNLEIPFAFDRLDGKRALVIRRADERTMVITFGSGRFRVEVTDSRWQSTWEEFDPYAVARIARDAVAWLSESLL